ncbi:hypothetical protein EDEG_03964 [Edhazardia aedis USNM 41457]|uniref:Uncharacterized protein n=1 Tax=Edhazardia aedis (strain USNM 41457) TaxID=1003232 RepID=J9DFN5_EDHAE|nr:hypothetical protein EDEG_03964 [Edhazardia aedis USNM 41457]|eukprot:EJW01415.1 hypothetical protein EDEG_03964 [Edhazardia aedis USNM 41457]
MKNINDRDKKLINHKEIIYSPILKDIIKRLEEILIQGSSNIGLTTIVTRKIYHDILIKCTLHINERIKHDKINFYIHPEEIKINDREKIDQGIVDKNKFIFQKNKYISAENRIDYIIYQKGMLIFFEPLTTLEIIEIADVFQLSDTNDNLYVFTTSPFLFLDIFKIKDHRIFVSQSSSFVIENFNRRNQFFKNYFETLIIIPYKDKTQQHKKHVDKNLMKEEIFKDKTNSIYKTFKKNLFCKKEVKCNSAKNGNDYCSSKLLKSPIENDIFLMTNSSITNSVNLDISSESIEKTNKHDTEQKNIASKSMYKTKTKNFTRINNLVTQSMDSNSITSSHSFQYINIQKYKNQIKKASINICRINTDKIIAFNNLLAILGRRTAKILVKDILIKQKLSETIYCNENSTICTFLEYEISSNLQNNNIYILFNFIALDITDTIYILASEKEKQFFKKLVIVEEMIEDIFQGKNIY